MRDRAERWFDASCVGLCGLCSCVLQPPFIPSAGSGVRKVRAGDLHAPRARCGGRRRLLLRFLQRRHRCVRKAGRAHKRETKCHHCAQHTALCVMEGTPEKWKWNQVHSIYSRTPFPFALQIRAEKPLFSSNPELDNLVSSPFILCCPRAVGRYRSVRPRQTHS